MPRKIYKTEEIIAKLRRVEVLTSQGQAVIDAVRSIGVTDATYYRWCQEYGDLKLDQVKRLKELEAQVYATSARSVRPDAREVGFERFGRTVAEGRVSRPNERETSKPLPLPGLRKACCRYARRLRAFCLPGSWTAPFVAA